MWLLQVLIVLQMCCFIQMLVRVIRIRLRKVIVFYLRFRYIGLVINELELEVYRQNIVVLIFGKVFVFDVVIVWQSGCVFVEVCLVNQGSGWCKLLLIIDCLVLIKVMIGVVGVGCFFVGVVIVVQIQFFVMGKSGCVCGCQLFSLQVSGFCCIVFGEFLIYDFCFQFGFQMQVFCGEDLVVEIVLS